MDKDVPDNVSAFLSGFDSPAAAIARRASEVIIDLLPEAYISLDARNIGFGIGTGYKGLIFTVTPQRAHVTLGIAAGARLPDPAGLMQGEGKVHRHVKLRTEQDLDQPELIALMKAAVAAKG
jgi:hypothetical protein